MKSLNIKQSIRLVIKLYEETKKNEFARTNADHLETLN